MRLLVLGDVLVELTCQVPCRFRDVDCDLLTYAPVETALGGTAANFALAATLRFDEVILGGCVGEDVFGAFAVSELEAAGVRCMVRRAPDVPTGLAIYQRDSSSEIAKGVRHLVIAAPSANDAFGLEDVEEFGSVLQAVDLVVADCYAMRHAVRREATLAAMTRARSAGAGVVLDIVPHDCFRHYSLADLLVFVAPASIVIIEVRTLLGFVGVPFRDAVDDADVNEAVALAIQIWPDKVLFLRHGIGNVDEVIALSPDMTPVRYRTGYAASATPRGFGDRLAVDELAHLITGSAGLSDSVERESEEDTRDVVLKRLGRPFQEEVC